MVLALPFSQLSEATNYVVEKMSLLVNYMAGYVARKFRTKHFCGPCASKLAIKKQDVADSEDTQLTKQLN